LYIDKSNRCDKNVPKCYFGHRDWLLWMAKFKSFIQSRQIAENLGGKEVVVDRKEATTRENNRLFCKAVSRE